MVALVVAQTQTQLLPRWGFPHFSKLQLILWTTNQQLTLYGQHQFNPIYLVVELCATYLQLDDPTKDRHKKDIKSHDADRIPYLIYKILYQGGVQGSFDRYTVISG